jgi:hypothetical protein
MKALLGFASVGAVVVAVLLLHGAGHASSPFAVAVANAAVRCPDGFSSVSAHGLPAGSQPTATLSASCALDFGIPVGATGAAGAAGPAGAQGPAGTPGTPGVSGYALKTTTLNASKSNSYRLAATVKCPAGKKAIGGGARTTTLNASKSNSYRFAITTTQPTPDGQGWTAIAINLNSSKSNAFKGNLNSSKSNRLEVTVICAVVS